MDDRSDIATERLALRPLALEHAAALHEMFADPEAMRFWHAPPSLHLDQTRAVVAELRSGPQRAWALFHRSGGEAIGIVYYLGNPGVPGMGYILNRNHWGKGLMSEAVRGALAYGFEELGLDRVELWIDARNIASQGVAERIGFKRRGAFRQKYNHDADAHEKLVYGLRIGAWRAGAAAKSTRPIEAYSLQPVLAVADVRATADYYRDRLGFEIAFLFGAPPTYGAVALYEWTATGAHIHLSRADRPPTADGLSLYVNVGPGIDALHETYRARAVDIVSPVVRQPWGMREFAIRDCNGYILRFGTPG